MSNIKIYTDGACRGNPGQGGWGVLIISDSEEKKLYGGEQSTTNNRMELMAAIKALEASPIKINIDLYTDSKYVMDGINSWVQNWKKNGWKTAARKPVKNSELWIQLDELNLAHNVNWHWVKGHSGDEGNEKADQLANLGIDTL
jgi:ribonuclease HI|tara:strand:+ start:661 stop:1092 length:432 start_codon:yes stop_codon:yes gene_type:complete